jgi:hypothetical protein
VHNHPTAPMKTLLRLSFLAAALSLAASAFAAESVHLYLKLTSDSGKTRVVACPSGQCVIGDLDADGYTAVVCDKQGNPVSAEVARQSVVTAREAGSGMATGKRQHAPIRITKEWGAASPQLRFAVSEKGAPVCLTVAQPAAVRESPTKASLGKTQ